MLLLAAFQKLDRLWPQIVLDCNRDRLGCAVDDESSHPGVGEAFTYRASSSQLTTTILLTYLLTTTTRSRIRPPLVFLASFVAFATAVVIAPLPSPRQSPYHYPPPYPALGSHSRAFTLNTRPVLHSTHSTDLVRHTRPP